MFLASSQQSFRANALAPLIHNHKYNKRSIVPLFSVTYCRHDESEDHSRDCSSRNENKLAKVAIVTLAAGVLIVGSVGDASAAKSGGRVGGQAFRSAPRSSPRINNNNSRTNIYVNPPVAPPLVGGYGYGYGYGGWGWSPFSFFTPGPSVAVGIGGGFDSLLLFLVLGAVAAVVRRFLGSTRDEDDY